MSAANRWVGLSLLLSVSLLAGCGSNPPVPDWQVQTHQSVGRATAAELSGHARVAGLEWARAEQQAARSALPDAVARVRLTRCAARRASLDWLPCEGLDVVLPDASGSAQAYARYLGGTGLPGDVTQLPPAQQAVARALAQPGAEPLRWDAASVADPLSRLVAASVLVRAGRAGPEVVAQAVDTASAQGWTRPLLAWLTLQRQQAQAAGNTVEAQRLERRLQLLAPSPTQSP
jgi:hypothetical protein